MRREAPCESEFIILSRGMSRSTRGDRMQYGNLRFKNRLDQPYSWEVNLPFLLCFTLYLRVIFQVQGPWGLIFGGAI